MAARAGRIVAFAVGFLVLFSLSQQATAARYPGEETPGLFWAIGVLSFLFLLGAFAIERLRGGEDDHRKDALWGLGAGGVAIVLLHLT
jgi:peptidoglycan/LPS O-acetylase OafA/YrhL